MIAPFEELIKEFKNNNEISKKLVKVIPVATEIHINWDCTADVNRVYYTIEGEFCVHIFSSCLLLFPEVFLALRISERLCLPLSS